MLTEYLTILQWVTAGLSLVLILYFLVTGRKSKTLYSYLLFQSMILLWIFHKLLPVLLEDRLQFHPGYGILMDLFKATAINLSSASLLLFSLHYTGSSFLNKKGSVVKLFLVPVMFILADSTNIFHLQYYSEYGYGALFWINSFVCYAYAFTGILLLVYQMLKQTGFIRKQNFLVTSGILITASICFLQDIYFLILGNHLPASNFDLTTVGFFITLATVTAAAFKYNFLDIVPLASKTIVNNMSESIVVIDSRSCIISFNSSFANEFRMHLHKGNNRYVHDFVQSLRTSSQGSRDEDLIFQALEAGTATRVRGELRLDRENVSFYNVNIQPVFLNKRNIVGRVASFVNITEYKELLRGLSEKNIELDTMNEQLKEYAGAVEELAVAEERNRISRDIHDTLGHTMTKILTLAEVARICCTEDNEKAEEKISEIIDLARSGLSEVRKTIEGISSEKISAAGIVPALENMFAGFESSGVKVDFMSDDIELYLDADSRDVIYRTCQEALTNSLRHGKATLVSITIKLAGNLLKLYVFDNGSGCKDIKAGFGLTGMADRVDRLGGRIVYGSDGETGFYIRAEIPVKAGINIAERESCNVEGSIGR